MDRYHPTVHGYATPEREREWEREGRGGSKQTGGRVGAKRERPSHVLTILTLLHDIVEERSY